MALFPVVPRRELFVVVVSADVYLEYREVVTSGFVRVVVPLPFRLPLVILLLRPSLESGSLVSFCRLRSSCSLGGIAKTESSRFLCVSTGERMLCLARRTVDTGSSLSSSRSTERLLTRFFSEELTFFLAEVCRFFLDDVGFLSVCRDFVVRVPSPSSKLGS